MTIFEPNQAIRAAIERRGRAGSFSQLWSDALFARERAREEARLIRALADTVTADAGRRGDPKTAAVRQRRRASLAARIAQHDWDRGVYARSCVVAAWAAFERAAAALQTELHAGCFDALELVLSEAVWATLATVKQRRDRYVEQDCELEELLATETDAEEAIVHVRAALAELHRRLGRCAPGWIDNDGVPERRGADAAWATTVCGNAFDDAEAIEVAVVHRGVEWTTDLLPHDTDPWPTVLALLDSISLPISAVRVRQGDELLELSITA